jgi:hypothetical protein
MNDKDSIAGPSCGAAEVAAASAAPQDHIHFSEQDM